MQQDNCLGSCTRERKRCKGAQKEYGDIAPRRDDTPAYAGRNFLSSRFVTACAPLRLVFWCKSPSPHKAQPGKLLRPLYHIIAYPRKCMRRAAISRWRYMP